MDDPADDHGGGYIGRVRKKFGRGLLHIPGAVIVVDDGNGQLLFQQRSDNGLWCFPGGAVEDGENATEQAIRETYEETGLKIIDPRPFGFASEPKPQTMNYPNGDICQFHDLLFYATEYTGELTLCDETLDLRWCRPDDTPPLVTASIHHLSAYKEFKATGNFQMV